MTIEVKFYNFNDSLRSTETFDDSMAAFQALVKANLQALARPVDTTSGCYSWTPGKDHTFEGFRAKLACCCNSPMEYHDRVEQLYGFHRR